MFYKWSHQIKIGHIENNVGPNCVGYKFLSTGPVFMCLNASYRVLYLATQSNNWLGSAKLLYRILFKIKNIILYFHIGTAAYMQTERSTNNRHELLPRQQKLFELADNFTTNTIQISGSQNKFSQLIVICFPGFSCKWITICTRVKWKYLYWPTRGFSSPPKNL